MIIDKSWKIESDNLNATLYRFTKGGKKKDGTMSKGNWTPEAYFSNLPNALKHLVNLGVQETKLKDLRTVINRIDELEKKIDKALQSHIEKH